MQETQLRRSPSTIELLLDADAEDAVRAEWDALAALGVSSLAGHTSPSNRPHITVLARVDLPPLDDGVLDGIRSFPITLGAPLLFGSGDRRVLARGVVPTAELLDLHARVLSLAGPGEDAPHIAPGEWTPHVTLARRLRVADLEAALAVVGGDIRGHVVSVRHWDPGTARITTLATLPLGQVE
ncbi:2'-5' RNA ligase family protein [Microbacterium sp. NPDC090225]|uniref:2'-5' RNA ligase family protein n=1 Tax=Microbacterium sp. NPDC090225 TaxID=3364207 RepID=UPI0037F17659